MDKPTVGRRVWYWPHPTERSIDTPEGEKPQAFDAGVAHVNEDGTINVSLTNEFGTHIGGRQNVVLRGTPDDALPGECSWMQYHVDTAKAKATEASQPNG